ncbi:MULTISPECIES: PstS family phosphate ABC transporter substrate-binding protein [unclassified Arcicella]|uniref:PstS family phosphate ABC transporter substrate-binding protein n=1 Tax=unclassified Arcicella TaxID=2644986 RepID=UPI00285A1BB8|nr:MULTISPECIES: PstS family phosphate ABC transporter substrate-binding protein [unclassified Arcicella]MDR6563560.1 phosphate transport system substrate-binding protein [Arcicella sp. BE51]MDR6813328.1 phosphate transport system substrate-binding protein [Arcicella sp. BE140]MDR6824642.1 phosphate transport system substrate-binding protein [Arcicella sp. BE139]
MRYSIFLLLFLLFSCSHNDDTIKIKGSDTEVNLAVQLAESFHQTNSEVFVSISGGGSGLGIASLLNNTADIANSSRSINKVEIDLFKQRGIPIDSFIFAQDAIAFVVASDFPIDSINTQNLANVFGGKFKDWSPIIGKRLPINIYGRQSNSGTHDFVKKRLKIEFSPYAKQMNGNAQILEAIKADHSGIGYVGAGYVIHGNKGIKVLTIYDKENQKAVSPLDAAMIRAGKYYFQRPLYQYYKSDSYLKIKPFLDFEKSKIGKKIIQTSGYYPVNIKP